MARNHNGGVLNLFHAGRSPTPSLRENRFVRDPNAPNGPPPQGVRGRRIWTQFKLCKNQRFDLPGPKTRFFSTRRPQNLHVVHSAQTRTRPLAIDMHVGGRANTRSRDPGRTKLYCQSRSDGEVALQLPGTGDRDPRGGHQRARRQRTSFRCRRARQEQLALRARP